MGAGRRRAVLPALALAVGAAVFAVAAPALADTTTPAPTLPLGIQLGTPTPAPSSTPSIPDLEAQLFAKLNAERAAGGVQPLARQPWADAVARAHSEDMAAARNIWHNYTGYIDAAKQVINAYVDGENVAEAGTLDETDTLLTTSPPHRANILYPLFNSVGIGVAIDSGGYVYVTQDFADVKPAAAPAPAAPTAAKATTVAAKAPSTSITAPVAAAPAPPAAAPAAAAPVTSKVAPAPTPSPSVARPLVAPAERPASSTSTRRPGAPAPVLLALILASLTGALGAHGLMRHRAQGRLTPIPVPASNPAILASSLPRTGQTAPTRPAPGPDGGAR